jgi:hypothetical protein
MQGLQADKYKNVLDCAVQIAKNEGAAAAASAVWIGVVRGPQSTRSRTRRAALGPA